MGLFSRSSETESVPSSNPEPQSSVVPRTIPPDNSVKEKADEYGIEDAIKLMRDLPDDNIEMVVTVVKKTLESTDIHVSQIISDAEKKEVRIRDRVKKLEAEIANHEESIADRKNKISALSDDLSETTRVKEHLQLAESANSTESAATAAETAESDANTQEEEIPDGESVAKTETAESSSTG